MRRADTTKSMHTNKMRKKLNNYILYLSIVSLTLLSSCANNSDEVPSPTPPSPGGVDITAEDMVGEWVLYNEAKEVFKVNSAGEGSGVPYRDPGYTGFYVRFENVSQNIGEYFEKNPFNKETVKGKYWIVGKDSLRVKYKVLDKEGNPTTKDTTVTKLIARNPSTGTFVLVDRYKYHTTTTYGVRDYSKYRNKNNTPTSYPDQPLLILNKNELIGSWIQTKAQTTIDNITSDSLQYINSKVTFKTDGTYEFRNPPASGQSEGELATWGDYVVIDDVIHFRYQGFDESLGKQIDKGSTFCIRYKSGDQFETYDRMMVMKGGMTLTMTKIAAFRKE